MKKNTWSWGITQYLTLGCLILIGGYFLFMLGLTRESVWSDEAFTWAISHHSFANFIKFIATDVHPPLYYLSLKAFYLLAGDSIFAIRLFSVFGALALAALGLGPVRRACGNKTGLLFTGLVLSTPMILSCAQDGRMYTWSAFFVTGTVLYAYFTATGNKWSDWVKLGILTLGAAYINYFALLAVTIANIILLIWLIMKDWRRVRIYLVMVLAVLICYLPWIPIFMRQVFQVKQDYWIPPVSLSIIWSTLSLSFGDKFSTSGLFIFQSYVFLLAFAMIIWGLRQIVINKQMNASPGWFAFIVYSVTIIVAIILSYFFRPIMIPRYLMAVLGLFILGLTIGLTYIKKKWIFFGVITILLAVNLLSIYQISQHRVNGPMAEVVSYIKSDLPADTVFVHVDGNTLATFCYYFPHQRHFLFLPNTRQNYDDIIYPQAALGPDLDLFLKDQKKISFVTTGDERLLSEITVSKKLNIVSQTKKFELPYSWYKVSVTQLIPQ